MRQPPSAAAATAQELAVERRLLRLSTAAAGFFAVLGIGWGLLADSQVILLDGMYALIGVLLGGLSLRAARQVELGPTARYPFGREALAPLVVGVQGLVLLGSLAYAVVEAIAVILDGGGSPNLEAALAYSVVSALGALAMWWALARGSRSSELVAAEAAQWAAGLLLSVGMFLGFAAALWASGTWLAGLVPYVDPVMVVVASACIAPTPVGMLLRTYRELLEGAPPPELAGPIEATVGEVSQAAGLPDPVVRMGKLGRKVYVEIDYLVPEGRWSISDADAVRRELMSRLAQPGRLLWINVELHTDPAWDAD